MIKKTSRQDLKDRRHFRTRKKMSGTSERPRLSVFRSEKHIYAQFIDDEKALTLASASSILKELRGGKAESKDASASKKKKETKSEGSQASGQSGPLAVAKAVGQLAAKRALEKGITQVVFDRGGFKYHGRIKAFADGAREAGLKF